MNKSRLVYWNGHFIPESEARISIFDSALMMGDCIFEMTRSFKGKQFKLREHIERLYNSAKYTRIDIPITPEEMIKAVLETVEVNKPFFKEDDEHRIMINITRGLLGLYDGRIDDVAGGVNIIISDFPLRWTVSNMGNLYNTGINAVIPSQRAISSRLLEPKVKNRSRIHYQMANIEVSQMKGKNNWALLLDEDGFVTEGCGSNFFIVKGKYIYTPEGRNILKGISRDYIFELVKKWELGHLKCIEKNIEPYDILMADEAFMTATPFCILPVSSLNGEKIGHFKPINHSMENTHSNNYNLNSIVKFLLYYWSQNVGIDIVQQIKDWSKENKHNSNQPTPYEFKRK